MLNLTVDIFRCCICFDRVKWCYSEVVFQFYKTENVIKIRGTFREPGKVKMWPTVFTDVLKGILSLSRIFLAFHSVSFS